MQRNLVLLLGAVSGAVAAGLLRRRDRRSEPGAAPPADVRAEELRRKLLEARETAVEEDDFEATEMGPEIMIGERPTREDSPLRDDVDQTRRRIHEEGRATAEEMRRGATEERG